MSGRRAIDRLIQSSLPEEYYGLRWIHYSEFANIKLSQYLADQTIHYAQQSKQNMILLSLGDEKCTPEFITEFASKYSLPVRKLNFKQNTSPNHFRRYKRWLVWCNYLIKGFTEHEGSY